MNLQKGPSPDFPGLSQGADFRTHPIGANPKRSNLNFFGRTLSELRVLLLFLRRTSKMLPKTQFSKPLFGHPAGSAKIGSAPSQIIPMVLDAQIAKSQLLHSQIAIESRDLKLSCTRLRVPPVALHVSRYTCRS